MSVTVKINGAPFAKATTGIAGHPTCHKSTTDSKTNPGGVHVEVETHYCGQQDTAWMGGQHYRQTVNGNWRKCQREECFCRFG